MATGSVGCWGSNYYGQLGDGVTSWTARSTPTDVTGLGSAAAAVGAGEWFSCALTTTGGVSCWGLNYLGSLGDGSAGNWRTSPVEVVGLQSGVASIAVGGQHACALMTSAGVKCWGFNTFGKVGDGSSLNNRVTPVDVVGLDSSVVAVAAGGAHTCALTAAGAVQCWGFNEYGQLGNGSASGRSANPAPIDVVGLEHGVAKISAGAAHSCAVMETGAAKCWGLNSAGQLGASTTETCYAFFPGKFVPCSTTPVDVTGLTNGVRAVVAGSAQSCAITEGGGLKCWGQNNLGQLGDGSTTDRNAPVDVVGLTTGVSAVALGGEHTCALTTAGNVKCWGTNLLRQLADGTTGGIRTAPVDVLVDSDSDGCTDVQEAGSAPSRGGRRNRNSYWDFFDTPDAGGIRDRAVTIEDVSRVIARFGTTFEPGYHSTDPLDPAGSSGYHPAFDRGGLMGPDPWNLDAANGSVTIGDVIAAVMQFGHSCVAPS